MDPYLEPFWGDVHSSLIVYFRDQINDQLPADLQARVEESLMADIVLRLQPLLDECYLRGRYASLDYTRSLTPQFDGEDRSWTNELLQQNRQ